VGILATARILALILGVVAGGFFGTNVAVYLAGVGPIGGLLGIAREVLRALAALPIVGQTLGLLWTWVVVFLLWFVGAVIASLLALIPYEIFHALWEHHDLDVRNTILRRTPPGWTRREYTFHHRRHTVFRTGSGPAVIVMHEFPGLSAAVLSLASVIADAGFTVYVPWLFGDVNHPVNLPYSVRSGVAACISREFGMFARDSTAPVARWLRAMADEASRECQKGKGVGVLGLCFTGGFALATSTQPNVLAAVVSEPALPVALLPWTRTQTATDIGLSEADIRRVAERTRGRDQLKVLGFRFSCDELSPAARFERFRQELGENFVGEEIPSGPGSPWNIPERAHSVLTVDRVPAPDHPTEQALEKVLAFFQRKLALDPEE
jgi:dienelactone hydrolase